MAKRWVHTVTVMGTAPFPIDMLRYDRLTPDSETDSSYIAMTFNYQGPTQSRPIRLRHDSTDKNWGPTTKRWESFVWFVIKVESQQTIS